MEKYSNNLNKIVEFLYDLGPERNKILFGKSIKFKNWLLNFENQGIQHQVNILSLNFI